MEEGASAEVMRHFFSASASESLAIAAAPPQTTPSLPEQASLIGFEHCEESLIDARTA